MVQTSSTNWPVFAALKPNAQSQIRWGQVQRSKGREVELKGVVFRDESLSTVDQFFLFLCRIRLGLFEQDLAIRFAISQTSVSRILITWSNYLYFMLSSIPVWASYTIIDSSMLHFFKDTCPSTRVVFDCTEIRVQTRSSKVLNSDIYSNYESHSAFRVW